MKDKDSYACLHSFRNNRGYKFTSKGRILGRAGEGLVCSGGLVTLRLPMCLSGSLFGGESSKESFVTLLTVLFSSC